MAEALIWLGASVPKNHDPCCSYSYALYNPEGPFNPIPDDCFPPG
jgi:hypothetical protein